MDKKLVVLALMFFLVLGAFSTALFFDQGSLKQTRATQKCEADVSKSFLVSLPKDVPAGGSCEVDAFVRCSDETSVVGAEVTLSVTNGTASPASVVTDESGKATFSVTGAGLAQITALVNNSLPLTQTVTCNFAQ
jgi:hypothetical protein